MIAHINIGGKRRPVAFGHEVAYDYEVNTGRNYNDLMLRVFDMLALSAQMAPIADATTADMEVDAAVALITQPESRRRVETFSVVPFTDITYFGMLYAHRREGVEVDFEASDVAEWLFGDSKAMSACMRILVDSLPKNTATEEPGEAKKKPAPSARPTGKASSRPRQR